MADHLPARAQLHVQPAGVVQHPLGELDDPLTELGGGLPPEALQQLPRDGVPSSHSQSHSQHVVSHLKSWPGLELWKSTMV